MGHNEQAARARRYAADDAYIAERAAREDTERARATAPDGSYRPLPPTDEALIDIVERANNVHGSWVRATPSGYWFDIVEMARELLAHRVAARERQSTGTPNVQEGEESR